MRVLLDDESCRVEIDDAVIAQAERLIVTFAGIGPGKRPQGVPAPEFLGSASRYGAVVSVADKRRSWGNMLDVPRVSDAIRRIADGRPISTLGNSMGGFLAVLFSTPLQATTRNLGTAMPSGGRSHHQRRPPSYRILQLGSSCFGLMANGSFWNKLPLV